MDIHINKKTAILVVVSLLVGGVIGGGIGFVAGHEGGRHHERRGNKMEQKGYGYDNRADGETADDNGGAPNSDEQVTKTAPVVMQKTSSTTTPATPVSKTQ